MPLFPLQINHCMLANFSFAAVFAAPKVYGLRFLVCIKVKGNAMAHQKMGSLKRTIWQLRVAKVRGCCGETAGRAWRRLC
jgi:hypothetical protein